MSRIEDEAALEALYGIGGEPLARATTAKVSDRLTPLYRRWIMESRFCVLSTVGPEGTDGSPRGDDGPVMRELDERTLLMPDWRGNRRLDSLRNIVRDGRVSAMFMVPGSNSVVRVNGTAHLDAGAGMVGRFESGGRRPACVIVLAIREVYTQCARALIRSELWAGRPAPDLPSAGDILSEMTGGDLDGRRYDTEWPGRAARTMW